MIDPLDLLLKIAKERTKLGKWDDQPLQLIKVMPNTTKGDLAETFVIEYSKELGFDVEAKTSRLGDYDAKINGMTFQPVQVYGELTHQMCIFQIHITMSVSGQIHQTVNLLFKPMLQKH